MSHKVLEASKALSEMEERSVLVSFFFIYVFCGSVVLMIFASLIVTSLPNTSTGRLDVFFENLISSLKSGFKIGIIPLVFYFILMFMDVVPYPYS